MTLILLFLIALSYADDVAPDTAKGDTVKESAPVLPLIEVAPLDRSVVQMSKLRQSVDCLKVYLEDQNTALEKKMKEWSQPDIKIYEDSKCSSQLPQTLVAVEANVPL